MAVVSSFDAVAVDAGVTKGALYHHFASKPGFVEAVHREAIQRHAARVVAASSDGTGRPLPRTADPRHVPHGGPPAMSTTAAPPTDGAIDFTTPPHLQELLGRVRAFVQEDVLPAESEIGDPHDVLKSWHVVERLRDKARERGIYTPHLPVHRMVIARECLKLAMQGESTQGATGDLAS